LKKEIMRNNKDLSTSTVIPETMVSVYEAIFKRRSAWKFKNKSVPREIIKKLLSTVAWAPNHRLTEPWRFFVLESGSLVRASLGDLVYEEMLKETGDAERASGYKSKILDPPVIIYVYNLKGDNDFVTRENYASVMMGIQNMSLAGFAEGLAVTLETGKVTRVQGLNALFGASDDLEMVAMLEIGYPDEEPITNRLPVENLTDWL